MITPQRDDTRRAPNTRYDYAQLRAVTASTRKSHSSPRLGWVDFSQRETHDGKLGNFKAEGMALIARGSDVLCDHVVATFGDGREQEIFRGELPEGETVRIRLPQSSVDRVDFECRPADGYRASVDIAADTGGAPYDRYDDRLRFPDNR